MQTSATIVFAGWNLRDINSELKEDRARKFLKGGEGEQSCPREKGKGKKPRWVGADKRADRVWAGNTLNKKIDVGMGKIVAG